MMSQERKLYLPYLLHSLSLANFTGSLRLTEGKLERSILFNAGRMVHVQSQLQEETLGRLLLDEGKLTPAEYNRLLDMMIQTHRPAGEILITMGALDPQEVFSALEFQTRKKLINCFRMADFGFEIEPGPVPPEFLIARLEPFEILFTGIRAVYSVDRLLSEFPADEDTTFISHETSSARPILLGQKENKVFRLIGTGTTLARLIQTVPDLQQLLSILYGLHALKLVEASGIERPSEQDLALPIPSPEPPPLMEVPSRTPTPQAPQESMQKKSEDSQGRYKMPTFANTKQNVQVQPLLAEKIVALAREDHFTLLGVNREAKGYELKNAFFRLLRTYHLQEIDKSYQTAAEREIAQRLLDAATIAYRELSDDTSRQAYVAALLKQQNLEHREVSPRILADVEAQKGKLALSSQRYKEAEEHFLEAIRLHPKEPSYHCSLGIVLFKKTMEETPADKPLPDLVKKPFQHALGINPREDQPHLYLGYIWKRNGNFHRALKEFEQAVECNPSCTLAHSEIRLLKKRLGQKS
jgi:hypothetical protein